MSTNPKLNQIDLLSSLTEAQINALEENATYESCKKGDRLFKAGQEAKDVFFLLEGKVTIQVQLSSSPESLAVVVLDKPGQLIGWSGLMSEKYYTAAGVCQEDSNLVRINGKKFLEVVEMDCESGFGVLKQILGVVSQRLRNIQSVVLKTI